MDLGIRGASGVKTIQSAFVFPRGLQQHTLEILVILDPKTWWLSKTLL